MRWSFPVTHVLSGALVAEHIPFTGVKFTDTLDQGGTFTGSFPVGVIGTKLSLTVKDDLWRYVVWPCRYGEPVGAYVLTALPNTDLSSPVVAVSGQRFDALLNRAELYHDLDFTNVDQLDIARDLVRYGIGMDTVSSSPVVYDPMRRYKSMFGWFRIGGAKSDVVRTFKASAQGQDQGFGATDGKFIGDLLKRLSNMGDEDASKPGFEYRCDYGRDPDRGMWARVTFGYPMVGKTKTDPSRIVFEYPSDAVVSASYGADGANFATRVRALGRERDGVRPVGTRVNQTLLNAGYPLLDRNFAPSGATEDANLSGMAGARLRDSRVASGWSITLNGGAEPTFGTYRVGDNVILRAKRGDVRLPDAELRITGWSVNVDDTGEQETVSPELTES